MLRILRSIKYFIVHVPSKVKMVSSCQVKLSIHYLGYLSTVLLLAALSVGLYVRWMISENVILLLIITVGSLVFGISCALRYYFSYERVGQTITHLWLGCLLGLVIFTKAEEIETLYTTSATNGLFMTSLVCSCIWNIIERVLHLTPQQPVLLTHTEICESIGLVIGSLVTPKMDAIALSLLITGFCLTVISIRLKSLLGVLNLLILVSLSITVFFPVLDLPVNAYGLVCFGGRLAFPSILDLYTSSATTLERWNAFLSKSKIIRHLTVLGVFFVSLGYCVMVGVLSMSHKEWFVVVPFFLVFSVIWLCFHLIFFISTWKLMVKITDCNMTFITLKNSEDGAKSMNRIMSSKGVRHFGLISQRVICMTLMTTVVLIGIGWETRTGISLGLAVLVLPLESMALSLFLELGSFLGGTCTGYGLVAPANLLRPSSGATLLSHTAFQDISSRSTQILNIVQKFFSYHMVDSYGCDFSTSGLNLEYVENKLKAFFERRTNDGPRFDTYILYYSGDVLDNGEWALADKTSLKLDTILDWWRSKNLSSGSRLLLVFDSLHSYNWAREVSYVQDSFVAVQTCKFSRSVDLESSGDTGIGDFTADWARYNMDCPITIQWTDKERTVKAVFGVSRIWTDFSFHLPTDQDFAQHWDNNFPKLTRPLVRAVNFFQSGSICCCCGCITRCLKRKKMMWLPPKEIDTGHGFKLVRS